MNTANEFDGSDAGASPDEAVSWGKIKATARPVKVFGEASILFPLMVAETFARDPTVESFDDPVAAKEETSEKNVSVDVGAGDAIAPKA